MLETFGYIDDTGHARAPCIPPYFDYTRTMESSRAPRMAGPAAVSAFGALANDTRLSIFRLLVQAGPAGRPAGEIAHALDMPASSLSFHLAHLNRAGLIDQRRESRSLIYSANFAAMNGLLAFITENCCGGAGCAPAASASSPRKRKVS